MGESEIDGYRRRLRASLELLRSLPVAGRGSPGPADPETGESWDRGNVLAHTAELVPFWCAQVRQLLAGATVFGRGESGSALRREAIDDWSGRDEPELRRGIETGVEDLLRLLDELGPGDLDRRVTYRAPSGEREVDLRFPIDELLVGHLEAHLRQLQELG